MQWSSEHVSWLVKVLQPERTVASLPGGRTGLDAPTRASLLGLTPQVYEEAVAHLVRGAQAATRALLEDPAVCAMVDRLPVKPGGKVVAFGDSHTSDPQSWAVIIGGLLAARRPDDGISVVVSAVSGETSAHGLVRIAEVISQQPDWVLSFIGINDARTQGPSASKTLVHHEETARNLVELERRLSTETSARRLWLTPPAVNEPQVEHHWALSRFGVRFRNEDVARVAAAIRALEAPHVDLFSNFGRAPAGELLENDGLHLTRAGQQRVAVDVLRAWSALPR